MKCSVNLEELCDDGSDITEHSIEMINMLDTNQGVEAKELIGYHNDCDVLCKELHAILKKYPQLVSGK